MKVRIGIDIDNVISESYPAYLSKFNTQFNTDIRMEQIREFYFLNRYVEDNKVKYGMEMVDFIDEMVLDSEFQMGIPPVTAALKVIKDWSEKGFQIHYVTARPVQTRKVTVNWLKKHGFWVKKARIDLFDSRNGNNNDVPYKRRIADKDKLDVFIEDAIEIALGMDIPVFLLDRPWNQGKLKKNIFRVHSWQEIEDMLSKILRIPGDKN